MLSRLCLKNWRTHRESELRFSGGVNGLLGIMGAGKTSILESICFALFGTFPALQQRRIKLENVLARWPTKAKTAEVLLDFEVDDKKYQITRKIERGKGTTISELKCNGQILESPNAQRVTEYVEQLLKINYDLFSQIIYAEQNRLDYFLAVARGKRRTHFDELLRINKFEAARESTVKLVNKLKEKRKIKKEDWQRLAQQIESLDVSKMEKELAAGQQDLEKTAAEQSLLAEKKEVLESELAASRKKKAAFQELQTAVLKFTSQAEQIGKALAAFDLEEIKGYDDRFVDKQLKALGKASELQERLEKEIVSLEAQKSSLEEQLKDLEQEIWSLETKKDKVKEIKTTEKKIKSLEKKQRELVGLRAKLNSKIEEELKALAELEKASARCPVCETKLSKKKKSSIAVKKKSFLKQTQKALSKAEKEFNSLEQELEQLNLHHDELLVFARAEEEFKKKAEKKVSLAGQLSKMNESLKQAKKAFSPQKKKSIEAEIKRFEKIRDALSLVAEKNSLEEKLTTAKRKLDGLAFDEKSLEEQERALAVADKKLALAVQQQSSLKILLEEKQARLDEIKSQAALLEKYQLEVSRLEQLSLDLEKFKEILQNTQVALREQFVSSINLLMEEIWQTLYPYADYTNIRLFIEDDYVLQVQSLDGGWVDVEGQVSGGERMTAALTLRLALAALLAPHLKWLILDEPTHNLDQAAVEELASCLREKISSLVNQTILITHDEALAEAVTGRLYKLERGEGKREVTRVVG